MLSPPDGTDRRLVRRAQAGDRSALAALLRRHLPALWAYAQAQRPDAEDAARLLVEAAPLLARRLALLHDPDWFHVFAIRQLRTLAPQGGAAAARRCVLALEAARPSLPCPPAEYLDLAPQAFEARLAAARRTAGPGAVLPPPADLAARIEAALPASAPEAAREAAAAPAGRPRLPLPLAFLLALGLGGIAAGLLFRGGAAPAARRPPFESSPGSRIERLGPNHYRLLEGRLRIPSRPHPLLRIELGDRSYFAGPGEHVLERRGRRCRLERRSGRGLLRWRTAQATATTRQSRVAWRAGGP